MKNIFIIASCIVFLAMFNKANSQVETLKWDEITNISGVLEDDPYWLEVNFLPDNPQYGWICGCTNIYDISLEQGYAGRTTDGGNSWSFTPIYGAKQLEWIYFVDKYTGYCSGGNHIYKSTDGGVSWKDITPPEQCNIWGSYFIDANTGIALSGSLSCYEFDSPAYIYKTTDGGKNWRKFQLSKEGTGLSDGILYKDGTGFASGTGIIWKTTDMGSSWKQFCISGDADWQEDLAINGRTILVPYSGGCDGNLGYGGLRISTDMGSSWKDIRLGASMFGCFLNSPTEGWICGKSSSMYHTVDAGKNWVNENCGLEDKDLDDCYFINDTLGFVVGDGIYRSKKIMPLTLEINPGNIVELCQGDSVTLSIKEDFSFYQWSNGANTKQITVKSPGVYYGTGKNSNCEIARDSVIVSFYAANPIGIVALPSDTVCDGDSIKLCISKGYNSIKWSNGETDKDTIIVGKSGKYFINAKNSNGCNVSDSINVTIYSKFAPEIASSGALTFCDGYSVNLFSKEDFSKYEWYKDGSPIPNSDLKSITVTETGEYTLKAFETSGCSGVSDTISVQVVNDSNSVEILTGSQKDFFQLDTTSLTTVSCKGLVIKNTSSTKSITLNNAKLFRNVDFSLPPSQFPITIEPSGERAISICFAPRDLKIDRDTLELDDACSSHFVYLYAYGSSNQYEGSSNCTPVDGKSGSLDRFWYSFGYPIKSPDGVIVKYVYKYSESSAIQRSARLYNSLGEQISTGTFVLSSKTSSEGLTTEEGEIEIGLPTSSNQAMFLLISSGDSKTTIPICY